MSKNLLIGLGAAVVVVLGSLGFAFKHQIKTVLIGEPRTSQTTQTPTLAPTGAVVEKNEVDYTNSGFSPASITVKKGTAVKFVNKSSASMWVASDPHPTHTIYPEFDQKKNGYEFIFVFDKVGSWKFHNHAPFGPGGVITVTE